MSSEKKLINMLLEIRRWKEEEKMCWMSKGSLSG